MVLVKVEWWREEDEEAGEERRGEQKDGGGGPYGPILEVQEGTSGARAASVEA